MRKMYWSIVVASLLITSGIVKAETSEATDARTEIKLNKTERDFVLLEMRAFLQSVQRIIDGITKDDMEQVAEAAAKSGRAAQQGMPAYLHAKLPMAFKKLGGDTHRKFDELALSAEQLGDGDYSLSQLNVLMENCVACHQAFSLEVDATTGAN